MRSRSLCVALLAGLCAAPAMADETLSFRAGPKGATQILARSPGDGVGFKDCLGAQLCPELVVVPSSRGTATLGSAPSDAHRLDSEAQHEVSIKAFAIGRYEISTGEYLACARAKACRLPEWLEPGGEHNIETGRGVTYKSLASFISGDQQPIVGISWSDAVAYTAWLTDVTGQAYRLPSEAEWEYAARAGTATAYWWGDAPRRGDEVMACCRGCGSDHDGKGLYPIQSFTPNPWGLHNMNGNVWEWVEDFYCESYETGPSDGTARREVSCGKPQSSPEGLRVLRGGSCFYDPMQMRAAMRLRNWPQFRNQTVGFRVARDLDH